MGITLKMLIQAISITIRKSVHDEAHLMMTHHQVIHLADPLFAQGIIAVGIAMCLHRDRLCAEKIVSDVRVYTGRDMIVLLVKVIVAALGIRM
jgi:hypothetical protein